MNKENNGSSIILRCHPSYRSQPWFDWAHIQFQRTELNVSNHYDAVPGQIFLWLSIIDGNENNTEIYALARTLKQPLTPKYPFLDCFHADVVLNDFVVVPFESIKGVAYVLPGAVSKKTLQRLAPNGVIREGVMANNYFISIPQASDWKSIGW